MFADADEVGQNERLNALYKRIELEQKRKKMKRSRRKIDLHFAQVLQSCIQVEVRLGVGSQVLVVGHGHAHHVVLERVAFDEHLGDKLTSRENVFQFLRRNVFSLSQFEKVLLAVDDLERSVLDSSKSG